MPLQHWLSMKLMYPANIIIQVVNQLDLVWCVLAVQTPIQENEKFKNDAINPGEKSE